MKYLILVFFNEQENIFNDPEEYCNGSPDAIFSLREVGCTPILFYANSSSKVRQIPQQTEWVYVKTYEMCKNSIFGYGFFTDLIQFFTSLKEKAFSENRRVLAGTVTLDIFLSNKFPDPAFKS